MYIYTRIFTFFIFIYTYIFFKYTYSIVYLQYYCLNTQEHIFESTDVVSIYFVANPRKWWNIESSLLLRLSNPVEIAVVPLQQVGPGGWYWLCGELLHVAQAPLESTINQKTHSKLHSRQLT